jgi:2-desacetyl-2-hydroxyethyl bacteriochlorophyllide A dehydrogenase
VRAVRNTEDGVRLVDVPGVRTEGVRVSVASSGICGSDLHLLAFGPSPVTMGHEFCGHLDDGTPVAVLPRLECGRCDRCLAGQEQQCKEALGTMYGVTLDGGLADEVWVDPGCARVLGAAIPLEHACLVEPIAVALHGINRAGVEPGSRVLVVGAGPIGLCTIAAARAIGADVDVLARRVNRTQAAEQLGAGTAAGSDYDTVLDAAGTQSAIDQAIQRVRPGGTVGIVSSFWDPVTLGMDFQIKEATLVPSFTYGHHHGACEFEEAARILAENPDLPEAAITHHFALDDAVEAFRVAGDHSDAIKVVLHP